MDSALEFVSDSSSLQTFLHRQLEVEQHRCEELRNLHFQIQFQGCLCKLCVCEQKQDLMFWVESGLSSCFFPVCFIFGELFSPC